MQKLELRDVVFGDLAGGYYGVAVRPIVVAISDGLDLLIPFTPSISYISRYILFDRLDSFIDDRNGVFVIRLLGYMYLFAIWQGCLQV